MRKYAILFLTFVFLVVVSAPIAYVISTTSEKTVIYLDPGHGGFDGGAVGLENIYEKDIALAISLKLASYLEKTGFKVYLTRKSDMALGNTKKADIYKRVDLINKSKADLFICIHANSYPSPIVKGAQTFYNPRHLDNEILARDIQSLLRVLQPDNNRLAKSIQGKYLIDEVEVPGCLVEVGFLSNPEELSLLQTEDYQARIALMIYTGILTYLEKNGA